MMFNNMNTKVSKLNMLVVLLALAIIKAVGIIILGIIVLAFAGLLSNLNRFVVVGNQGLSSVA